MPNAGRYFPHAQPFFHAAKESMRAYFSHVNYDKSTDRSPTAMTHDSLQAKAKPP